MTYHEDLYMIYRDRLRALREDSDLSQKTIADYLGIGQTTYSQYELGKRFHASRIYYQTLPVL